MEPEVTSTVAPNGNVYLIVGPKRATIRVDAGCMGVASPVFREIIQQCRNRSPGADELHVIMEKEDPGPVKVICQIIHHQWNIELGPEPEALLKVALAAKNYHVEALVLRASEPWFAQIRREHRCSMVDEACMLAAASLLRSSQEFRNSAHRLICEYPGSYREMMDPKLKDLISWRIIFSIEESRSHVRSKLIDILDTAAPEEQCQCAWVSDVRGMLVDWVIEHPPSSIARLSIEGILDKLRTNPMIERLIDDGHHCLVEEDDKGRPVETEDVDPTSIAIDDLLDNATLRIYMFSEMYEKKMLVQTKIQGVEDVEMEE